MKKLIYPLAILLTISACELAPTGDASTGSTRAPRSFQPIPVKYPTSTQDSTISDDYHGKVIADPYRWLEDDRSEATAAWVSEQNAVTFDYLQRIPYREAIRQRLEKLWNYERYGSPFERGGRYFYFKNDGLQNQAVLYIQDQLDSPPSLVLDPNKFAEDGTVSLGGFSFSDDGRYLAYEVSEGGSDWRSIYIKDVVDNRTLSDKLEWIKFSAIAWQGKGFFYSRYPAPQGDEVLSGKNEFQSVYYHKLGTPQSEDQVVFADRAHPSRGFFALTTEDERFLTISVWESTSGNAIYFKDLQNPEGEITPIYDKIEYDFSLVDNLEDRLLVMTNYQADNNRLIAINTNQAGEGFWEEILPESKDKLSSVRVLGGKIVATYIHDASSQVKVYDLDGQFIADLKLPGIGTVGGFSGKKKSEEAFYSFSSFTRPTTIYRLDLSSLESTVFKAPQSPFQSDDYETRQVWFTSADGTEVPMFLTHKKGLKMDGERPTLLYGYGGFDISILPNFQVKRTVILENGGIYAVANIRGGGEFGKKWHRAGTKANKQNVFNDFQAAAEYLIAQGYTSKDKLAIEGRSNGGLLIGACMTQRPDLYKVAFPAVGVLDMLRYQNFTIGRAWASDYGLSENPEEFDYLVAYSPLHNVEARAYPATMVTTADHDDRVVPAHSFKFAATLQAHQEGDNPVLIRVETSAGHGAGTPTSKLIEEAADALSFMYYNFEEDVIYEATLQD
ncbi:MAG: prolyl oligopeptidase family serine peptidase [Bacteroidota bacterium]